MIRRMLAEDVAAAAELFTASPEAAHWRARDLSELLTAGARGWVEEAGYGPVVGAVVMREAAGEMEILNLAVASAERGKGIGRGLMETAFRAAKERGANRAFLEVRESNAGARSFYARLGFSQDGRRRNYYREPQEDALLLSRRS
jgi:ribosomal-protein-alanine N-acetyltransferase